MRRPLGKMRHVLSTILLQQHFSNISCHKRIGFITFKSHEKTKTKAKQKHAFTGEQTFQGGLVGQDFFSSSSSSFKYFSLSRAKMTPLKNAESQKVLRFFEETVSKVILSYFHKIFSHIFFDFGQIRLI